MTGSNDTDAERSAPMDEPDHESESEAVKAGEAGDKVEADKADAGDEVEADKAVEDGKAEAEAEVGAEVEADKAGKADEAGGDAEAGVVPGWAQWGLLAAALVVLVVGVLAWRGADDPDDVVRAEQRDAVVIAATKNIEILQSMDYNAVDDHLTAWADVTTGVLHDQLDVITDEERQLLVDQKAVATGEVVDLAITELNADTASVIAAIEVTTVNADEPDAEPAVKRNRYAADLVLRGDTWKVETLTQVAVNLQ